MPSTQTERKKEMSHVIKTIAFNTGRKYTNDGQIIVASLYSDDTVTFMDHSRHIDGEFNLPTGSKFCAGMVMRAYDGTGDGSMQYLSSFKSSTDGMQSQGCNTLDEGLFGAIKRQLTLTMVEVVLYEAPTDPGYGINAAVDVAKDEARMPPVGHKIIANSAAEASKIYSDMRDQSGEGASTFAEGEWQGNRISYNGKVWAGAGDWNAGDKPIYDPYEAEDDGEVLEYFDLVGESVIPYEPAEQLMGMNVGQLQCQFGWFTEFHRLSNEGSADELLAHRQLVLDGEFGIIDSGSHAQTSIRQQIIWLTAFGAAWEAVENLTDEEYKAWMIVRNSEMLTEAMRTDARKVQEGLIEGPMDAIHAPAQDLTFTSCVQCDCDINPMLGRDLCTKCEQEMAELTNNDTRADRAQKAIDAAYEYDYLADRVSDLLTDLHHLCAREKVDMSAAIERSRVAFHAETVTAPAPVTPATGYPVDADDAEKKIIDAILLSAINFGYHISVSDGEEYTVVRSTDLIEIRPAIFTTDETTLMFRDMRDLERDGPAGRRIGTVLLVHGNGHEVISDHTDSSEIEALLVPASCLAHTMSGRAA